MAKSSDRADMTPTTSTSTSKNTAMVAALNHTVIKPARAEVGELTSFTVFPKLPIEIRLKI
jgi:hypothetical protein